ncbi:ryncolin-2 [Drosophila yakuba]|uniref:Fibrinogen C-terminal domain-containing protein n=1 Tax=Drosophila yakuba TaxID=7245 RepID=B4NYF7_DROYA|nr:ryncolin-2 [Drosophila yakuba]EDW87590.2 uncharacterized protein Dyak_GE14792 [Drosophila yakuba]
MLCLGILFVFFLRTVISHNCKELCTLQSICDNLTVLKSEVAAIREEQKRQAEILERLDKKFDSCMPPTSLYPASCAESSESNLVIRVPKYSEEPFEVTCDQESHGGGWTMITRRNDGSQNFYLEWMDYKKGFGKLNNEFFIGLDKLHAMTASEPQELLVLLEDYEEEKRYQLYFNFSIGSEDNDYILESTGNSIGDAGDSLEYHLGMKFSTKDRQNDFWDTPSCAVNFMAGWWYRSCHMSHIFGRYGKDKSGLGIIWNTFNKNNSTAAYMMKRAQMLIRPRRFSKLLG